MKNSKIISLIFLFAFLCSCTSFNETMSGRSKNTDEFLVKKKDPLVLPPKYEELPLPKSKKEKSEKTSIEKMLGSSSETSNNPKSISSLENMILKELSKKN